MPQYVLSILVVLKVMLSNLNFIVFSQSTFPRSLATLFMLHELLGRKKLKFSHSHLEQDTNYRKQSIALNLRSMKFI
jgi:hypothetical protein